MSGVVSDGPLWVQCDDCHKWRQLPDECTDAALIPHTWTCSLNTDPLRRSCQDPEQSYDDDDTDTCVFVEGELSAGSVVWALTDNHWMPAIVAPDTDDLLAFQTVALGIIDSYHVVFFGQKPAKAWVSAEHCRSWARFNPETDSTRDKMLLDTLAKWDDAEMKRARDCAERASAVTDLRARLSLFSQEEWFARLKKKEKKIGDNDKQTASKQPRAKKRPATNGKAQSVPKKKEKKGPATSSSAQSAPKKKEKKMVKLTREQSARIRETVDAVVAAAVSDNSLCPPPSDDFVDAVSDNSPGLPSSDDIAINADKNSNSVVVEWTVNTDPQAFVDAASSPGALVIDTDDFEEVIEKVPPVQRQSSSRLPFAIVLDNNDVNAEDLDIAVLEKLIEDGTFSRESTPENFGQENVENEPVKVDEVETKPGDGGKSFVPFFKSVFNNVFS